MLLMNNGADGVGKIRSQRNLQAMRILAFLPQYSLFALKVILMVGISYINKDEYVLAHFKSETVQEKKFKVLMTRV